MRPAHPLLPLVLLISWPVFLPAQGVARDSVFDFAAFDAFLSASRSLSAGIEPSSEQWASLFRTPGYASLFTNQPAREHFQYMMRRAFSPSDDVNQDLAPTGMAVGEDVQHLLRVRERLSRLTRYVDSLRTPKVRLATTDSARIRAKGYLPSDTTRTYPPVSLLVYSFDGHTGRRILVDVLAASEAGIENVLAHEFHHWYWQGHSCGHLAGNATEELLAQVFIVFATEGTADRIDKEPYYRDPGAVPPSIAARWRLVQEESSRFDEIVQVIDTALARSRTSADGRVRALNSALVSLMPARGRATGYRMATLIEHQLGKVRLARASVSPFGFVHAYDEAARRAGYGKHLSDASVRALRDLELRSACVPGAGL